MVHLYGEITNFWTYRSANVNILVTIDMDEFDNRILKRYIESFGYRMDNHICWEVNHSLYMRYSDHKLYIGNKITVRNW